MKKYQRDVVALIRASGARVAMLHDHRLSELWREYSQRRYRSSWMAADREEVYRFVTWTNNEKRLLHELGTRARELSLLRLQKRHRRQMIREG